MGCGKSRTHLLDEGVAALGSRNLFHHKTHTPPPKLLMTPPPPIVAHPPPSNNINTPHQNADGTVPNSDGDVMCFGSPSFREYIRFAPCDDGDATTEQGKESVICTHGGENMTCNGEVCVRGGRFRKVFRVHRVTFWHGGPWHVGHPKPNRKAA